MVFCFTILSIFGAKIQTWLFYVKCHLHIFWSKSVNSPQCVLRKVRETMIVISASSRWVSSKKNLCALLCTKTYKVYDKFKANVVPPSTVLWMGETQTLRCCANYLYIFNLRAKLCLTFLLALRMKTKYFEKTVGDVVVKITTLLVYSPNATYLHFA